MFGVSNEEFELKNSNDVENERLSMVSRGTRSLWKEVKKQWRVHTLTALPVGYAWDGTVAAEEKGTVDFGRE